MARTKAVLGAGARLSDFLSASLLARVYPAPLIASILDTHDCNSKRIRSLPAVPGTYFSMALSLYPEAAYEQVFAVVSQALSWMQGRVDDDGAEVTIAKSSISEMRTKIGYNPLQSLVAQACVPLANAKLHPEAFYAGLRLVAIDGCIWKYRMRRATSRRYGWVLAHYAVRWLMYQAATAHRQEPRSLSFTAHVQKLRRAQPQSGAFPPDAAKTMNALV